MPCERLEKDDECLPGKRNPCIRGVLDLAGGVSVVTDGIRMEPTHRRGLVFMVYMAFLSKGAGYGNIDSAGPDGADGQISKDLLSGNPV